MRLGSAEIDNVISVSCLFCVHACVCVCACVYVCVYMFIDVYILSPSLSSIVTLYHKYSYQSYSHSKDNIYVTFQSYSKREDASKWEDDTSPVYIPIV